MDTKLVIFDMDDVMWDLNARVAELTGTPHEKFICFDTRENPNFTAEQKRRIVEAYIDPNTYRNITFRQPVIDLINRIHRECKDCAVHIISNCGNQEISDAKKPQLLEVLELPEYKIHLDVIDIKTQTKKKVLPDNIFLLVDDSPHNIVLGNVKHRIMPARNHNNVLINNRLNGLWVDRVFHDEDLARLVMFYLKGEK